MNKVKASAVPKAAGASNEAGFTLVEALCAIVILVFGLIAIANLMLVASTSNTIGNHSTAATAEASQQLEVLKATPFTSLVAGGSVTACTAGYCNTTQVPGVGPIETRWALVAIDPQSYFISVRSEGLGVLARMRSRAEFTTIRACTDAALGCPAAGPPLVP